MTHTHLSLGAYSVGPFESTVAGFSLCISEHFR